MGETTAVSQLPGVGPKVAEKLARLGIVQISDLLFHLPLRYQDRTRIHPIGSLLSGQQVQIEATVEHSTVLMRKRRSLVCVLADGTGQLTLRLFHFYPNQQRMLSPGTRLRCFGEARAGFSGMEMVHPEFQRIGESPPPLAETLSPIYPTTEGLGQKTLKRLIDLALERWQDGDPLELLPEHICKPLMLPNMQQCLRYVHRPPADANLVALTNGDHPAQQRLAFEELLAHRLSLRLLRKQIRDKKAPILPRGSALGSEFAKQLPFELTAAQRRVNQEIERDLGCDRPAMRLIQGDVGSGKTVVAAAALVQAVAAGYQAALTAPTEILAEQHYRSLGTWFEPLGIRLAWLSGKIRGAKRTTALEQIAGPADVIVGTHALMQEQVRFRDLALVVVDEQHRFGVQQRLALRDKGSSGQQIPHQLTLTATPIPRTLAMTAYADLDVSVIDELPPGRTPVATVAASNLRRDEVVERVALACREGRQTYWVCTLIEESDLLEAEAATEIARSLAEQLPGVRVALIHGRLKADEKDSLMQQFKAGEIQLLVATTVIEVGVDVPNASLMVIENSERLGLSQLHQLRGRVGRGSAASSCVLLYQPPLSAMAKERLAMMRKTTDGFEIAQRDLELRGPGEVLGTRQTGSVQFRIADIARDRELLEAVGIAAEEMLGTHPQQCQALVRRWIGAAKEFAAV
jgi:ATP-dependent DNA helicase RecG